MSTATAPRTAPPPQSARDRTADEAASLFEELLQKQSNAMSAVVVRVFGGDNIERIRDVLPTAMKDEAERFVKRAALYFERKTDLQECTSASKLRCILEAAEMGLALDGRLCHAVSYNCKYKDEKNVERWRKEAQCQPDYKGLLVVARRSGSIVDVYGDVICEKDEFKHGRKGARSHLTHTYPVGDRGKIIGVYAVVVLEGGRWRYELMSNADVEAIRARSKAKGSGPWVSDYSEMAKKTVLRRALKLYCNDPGTIRALELDEREFDDDGAWIDAKGSKVRRSQLNDRPADPPAPGSGESGPGTRTDAHGSSSASDTPPAADPEPEDDERQPGDDDEPPFVPPADQAPADPVDETPLSDEALALEAKLNNPAIDRGTNAALLQEIMAGKFTEAERKHLKGIANRNTARLKGGKK